MDDVQFFSEFMVEFTDLLFRPIAEEKYGELIDQVRETYMTLAAQAIALGREEEFVKAIDDWTKFMNESAKKVLLP